MIGETKKLRVEKLTRKNLESLVDFWMKRYPIHPKERRRVSKALGEAISKYDRVHFLAFDARGVVGYLSGRSVPCPEYSCISSGVAPGVVGVIEDITTRQNEGQHDRRSVVNFLLDAHEKYFRSKPDCRGIGMRVDLTEALPGDLVMLSLLEDKGFILEGLRYQMGKAFADSS